MKKRSLIIISIILILILGAYATLAITYQNKFLPNTSINGVNIAKLSLAEAKTKVTSEAKAATLEIQDGTTNWQTINKADFGLTTDYDKYLNDLINKQNNWFWFVNYFKKETISTDSSLDASTSDKKLEELKNQLSELNKEKKPSVDAKLVLENGEFKISKEEIGTAFNVDAVVEQVKKDLTNADTKINLTDFIEKPEITADNKDLKDALAEAEKVSKVVANYTILGETFTIPKEKIADWIVFEDDALNLDEDKVRSYVEELGSSYNPSSNSTSFNSTRQGTVDVPAGSYSWSIQTEEETEALTKQILAGEDFTHSPIVLGATTDASIPLIGNTYIEVDLSAQHMWYYENGSLRLETDIVSGKPSTPTPTGVFYVWNKERNATLTGEDYKTPVDYWMPIDWNGVGIHDSSWQPSYGGTRYQQYGSHGCINTPPSVVAELFNMVNVGVPVIVIG